MLLITSVHYVPSESKVVRGIPNDIKPPNAKKEKMVPLFAGFHLRSMLL